MTTIHVLYEYHTTIYIPVGRSTYIMLYYDVKHAKAARLQQHVILYTPFPNYYHDGMVESSVLSKFHQRSLAITRMSGVYRCAHCRSIP